MHKEWVDRLDAHAEVLKRMLDKGQTHSEHLHSILDEMAGPEWEALADMADQIDDILIDACFKFGNIWSLVLSHHKDVETG